MAYLFNHVHLKAPDPKKTADWYVEAFGFEITADTVRDGGDRFIRCKTVDGVRVNISAARTDEVMGPGDSNAHFGIEHFGIEVDDLDTELKRLEGMGAKVLEGPNVSATGSKVAFIAAPDDVRIEVMQVN